ncbi:hypothetical protein ACH5RR_011037 [Cinchona calisaya]|uniref:Uncharacterized protein n=1 Tax=Cinchona calisaya TaxID=153742 RepID=A0ABD3A3R8_9GENT
MNLELYELFLENEDSLEAPPDDSDWWALAVKKLKPLDSGPTLVLTEEKPKYVLEVQEFYILAFATAEGETVALAQ